MAKVPNHFKHPIYCTRLLLVLFSVLISVQAQAQGKSSTNNLQQPNILIFLIDDLRADLGTYGSELVVSPNIDKLANEGVKFTRAYAQQAICGPSRVSILTGLRPETTGLYTIDRAGRLRPNHPDVVSMPQLFRENGYQTISIGKVYHSSSDDVENWTTHIPKLDNFYSIPGNKEKRFAYEAGAVDDTFYKDGKVAQDAIETLNRVKDDKFLMVVGFSKPHLPFNSPKKYWELYDRDQIKVPSHDKPEDMYKLSLTNWNELRMYGGIPKQGELNDELTKTLIQAYYASVSYMDAQLGKVMQALDKLELRENTLVVLMSDHGYKLGEYGAWNKHSNMELDTRVPLIISRETAHKSRIAGVASSALVENVDIFPTVAQAAGLNVPKVDGRSLVPLLDNPGLSWSKAAYSLFNRGKKYMGVTVTDGEWRYTEWRNADTQQVLFKELYDHRKSEVADANFAGKSEYKAIESKLKFLLDKKFPPQAPSFNETRDLTID
ncbi:MAG: sulfatase [Gammaproteobacteria bacterium]|nr:sulfatase [Gammaproteobacteria bacterium]